MPPDCTETHNGVIPTEKHMHFPSMLTTQRCQPASQPAMAACNNGNSGNNGSARGRFEAPSCSKLSQRETHTLHLSDDIGHVWHEWSNFDECHIVGNSSKFNFCSFRHTKFGNDLPFEFISPFKHQFIFQFIKQFVI